MKVHELKTWPIQFAAVQERRKAFEVRRNDRDFQERDIVVLREFVPAEMLKGPNDDSDYAHRYRHMVEPGYTGATEGPFRIGYVTTCGALPDGWCGFSLIRLVPEPSE